MRKLLFVAALIGISQIAGAEALRLDDIVRGEYSQKSVPEFRSMSDGEHFVAANSERTMIVKYAYKTGNAVDTLFNVATARDCSFKRFDGYDLSDDETRMLIYTDSESIYRRSFRAVYHTFEIRRNLVKPLSDGKQQAALFSPSGRMVAFVKDNNIFLKKLDYGTESQVTTDGEKNKVINGVPDWVYEEEFSMNSAMEWAPDNSHLVYLKFNEAEVKQFSIQMYQGLNPGMMDNELYPGEFTYKYPKAGEVNSKVEVHSFNIDNKRSTRMNVQVGEEDYIPRIRFTKDAGKLAVMTFNRHQNIFRMHFANPATGVSNVVLQDENSCYVNPDNMDCIDFYNDGFTFVSEKSGYRHIYYHNMNGMQTRQVTKGDWDVTDYYGYDPASKSFYFQAAVESPLRREVYKVNAKSEMISLSSSKGSNSARFSNNFRYFQNYYSNANSPLEVSVNDAKGKVIRVLETNSVLKNKLTTVDMPVKEFFSFKTSEGVTLNGYLLKPADFDAGRKYPVLMHQYSGPGSQQALDRWGIDWLHYLPQQGYIVACVDGRGTGARGAEFERCTYMSLGVKESTDQIEGAKYLATQPFVDGTNIAIWGWSFGGYNTLMALSGSDVFKVGIAVAPVTDWKFYDSIYTERYMRTPKENGDGYRASSVIERAENIKGTLLIVTGTADDNVHPQNTYELSEALVQKNVQFDMQLYTNRNHSIAGGNTRLHLYTKLYNYLEKNLK